MNQKPILSFFGCR